MPEFTNPFPGVVPREMTHSELIRAIMLNISAEYEAVHIYMAHFDATTNEEARKVLFDIAQEELVHAGEFTSLLYRLDPLSGQKAQEGFEEVRELLESRAPTEVETPGYTPPEEEEEAEDQTPPVPQGLTVGSLIGRKQGM